jgi:hypothetical protein
MSNRVVVLSIAIVTSFTSSAWGEPTAPPAPYTPPWQLRPAIAVSVFRSDTAVAFYDDATGDGVTVASTLLASYKLTPTLAPFARFAVTHDTPTMGEAEVGHSNALFGATWAPKVAAPYKVAVIGAITAPVGSGGGDTPDMAKVAVNRSAIMARSAMDNALFAVNDMTLIVGASAAYVDRGLTLQAEVTAFELIRVKGAAFQPDKFKTNLTTGLYAGYFLAKQVSLGAELRYQRYLSTPKFVSNDPTATLRDSLSAALGVRTHWKLQGKQWLRPGIAYARGLDDPMTNRNYQVLQVDLLYIY